MKRVFKFLVAMIIMISTLCSSFVVLSINTPSIVVKTFSVNETGFVEVYGYIDNIDDEQSHESTLLLIKGTENDLNNLSTDKIAYINQETCGNNYSFLFKFQLADKFLTEENLTSDFTLAVGSDVTTQPYRETINVSKFTFSLKHISNNNVIYGADAYSLSSDGMTAKNVADSIVYGGNKIYYKIGNVWYDLMNPKATDSSYLVNENAVDDETMENLPLRYYYKGQYKFNFIK